MKVLLVNTSFRDIYGYERMFPLGLGYIASVLRNNGYDVSLLQPQLDNLSDSQIKQEISQQKPDLIGITAVTPTFSQAVKISKLIKEEKNGTQIVLGGVHASSLPERIIVQHPEFDFLVAGEGEETMLELCNELKKEKPQLSNIAGLYFRDNGRCVKNVPRSHIQDLDRIPLPSRDLVDLHKYKLPLHIDRGKISASMITSRGCPAKCVFCSSGITMGKKFRPHSASYVIKEIENLIFNFGINHIQFVDDTFTISSSRVKEICSGIIEKKLKFEWHCFARVETVSEEILLLMKQAGCTSILFGIESGDQGILKNIKKGISLDKAREAHKLCKKFGINILSSFILGNPGETEETARRTINFACELKPTFALFYRLVPYPGSEAYDKYTSENRLRADLGWDSFAPKSEEIVFEHENLSKEKLDNLIFFAYRKFYLNPLNIIRILKCLRTSGQFKALFKGLSSITRQMLKWKS
ncbi:MAG: radical SAM protein [Candidatus Omnitrophica bacterium]|nr:radical SAM protein [Candidatus Omnitrophota bacterium]